MLHVLFVRIRILEVSCVDAGSNWRFYVVHCRFGSRVLEDPGPSILGTRRSNHDVISVNRRMCKCTVQVVGTVTTFSIRRRTDVNGGAGSGFSMMISHGVMVKVVVVQVGLM